MKSTSITKKQAISDEAPKLTANAFESARYTVGGKPADKRQWQEAVRARVAKQRINILLDVPIVEHFKALAGDRGYQTLINATLRETLRGQEIEAILRRVIREELRAA
jgi:uncharacterized protein (DUF4415 family)